MVNICFIAQTAPYDKKVLLIILYPPQRRVRGETPGERVIQRRRGLRTILRKPTKSLGAGYDFWSISGSYTCIYIYIWDHVVPRRKLYIPKDGFPVLVGHIDVREKIKKTNQDVAQEKSVDDLLEFDTDRSLSYIWMTRFTTRN